jgi:hypothetical protein
MRLKYRLLLIFCLILSFTVITSCTKDSVEEPSPVGPSGFANSFKVLASPNILFAGFQQRQNTTITAVLRKFNGEPLTGRTVFFEIINATKFQRAHSVGYFEGFQAVATRVTDGNGVVSINYYGPTAEEIPIILCEDAEECAPRSNSAFDSYYIKAYVAWEGNEIIEEWTPVYFVRDYSDIIFNVSVEPNILLCTNTRPEATIKVFFAVPDGTPLAGRKIFFEIESGPGNFSDGKVKTFKETGSDGYATMIYRGPTSNEMSSNEQKVSITVQPQTFWEGFGPYGGPDPYKYWLHADFKITLKKGT